MLLSYKTCATIYPIGSKNRTSCLPSNDVLVFHISYMLLLEILIGSLARLSIFVVG